MDRTSTTCGAMGRQGGVVWPVIIGAIVVLTCYATSISAVNVTYDNRALKIDGKRRFLQSGSIHYPRSTPEMWPKLIDNAKEGGLDVIQTYVFWDGHEPQNGTYNFDGRYDLVQFVKVVAAAGLYVNLRIGPYVCAEWNFGGFPVWLRFAPNIEFRTDNDPFKVEMERFTTKIVMMLKSEKLFASQGGPIILAQIENEYGNIDSAFSPAAAQAYIKWAADMANGLDIGVPWIMCQQKDAPANVINTCNGFYCDGFNANAPGKPALWTENWSGWFHNWGRQLPHRPVEDVAFAVARFFEKGGSFQNYYMYHGGTNFDRSAGEWITTSYDYDAPLDEYGQPRQPKWGHLRDLHAAIKSCEPALAVVDGEPFQISLGDSQEAHIYANGNGSTVSELLSSSTICAAFLASWDSSLQDTTVQFNGKSYDLPAWSVSILPDCKTVSFNTAKVGSQTTVMKMLPAMTMKNKDTSKSKAFKASQSLQWQSYQETVGAWGSTESHSGGLLEQINVTRDSSDYLWYTTSVQVSSQSSGTLIVGGVRDTVQVFINGVYAGSPNLSFQATFSQPVQLKPGNNNITVLSKTLGLQNYGALLEREEAGFGQAQLTGLATGDLKLTNQQWTYQVGIQGEQLSLFTESGAQNVTWQTAPPINQPLMWYKTMVDAPAGNGSVALDLGSMGKGQAWINGQRIGRFWTIVNTNLAEFPGGTCSPACNYRGSYNEMKCTSGCGELSQRWYHVPRDWLQPTKNFLVIFEETGGDPTNVSLTVQVTEKVCAHKSETHPAPLLANPATSTGSLQTEDTTDDHPKLKLDCSLGHHISRVEFGSFGNPSGTCGRFVKGSCHAAPSTDFVNQECLGKQHCSLPVSWTKFAIEDPCPGLLKSLAVEALCTPDFSAAP